MGTPLTKAGFKKQSLTFHFPVTTRLWDYLIYTYTVYV